MLAALTVGVSVATGTGNSGQDVGGNKGEQRAGLTIHGSDPNDGRFLYAQSGGSGSIKAFSVNSNGSLSPVGSWAVPDGGGQEGIAAA